MRILFIYRHFWPDTPPYASMLRSIAAHLVTQGHEVSLWCEMPSGGGYEYRPASSEVLDGIRVSRIRSLPLAGRLRAIRMLGAVLFPLRMLLRAVVRKFSGMSSDLVISATIPPVINGFFARLAARLLGARFIYHCQDIYPELGALTGLWRPDGWLGRLLMQLDGWTCRNAHGVVVLGEDMCRTLEQRGLPRQQIAIINNFMLQDFQPSPESAAVDTTGFQVIFAGNAGRFQGLHAVVDAIGMLQDMCDLEFLFLGGGCEFDALRRRCGSLANVEFRAGLPMARARPVIAAASLGIVSLSPGLISVAYPSKTLTYLGLGVPILAIVEPGSELADMIEAQRVGYVAGVAEGAVIAATIRRAYAERCDIGAMRNRAKSLHDRRFSRHRIMRQWDDLITATGPAG